MGTKRRVLRSVAAVLPVGLCLAAATGALASPAHVTAKAGGTLRVNLNSDIDYSDPALAYYSVSWQMEYATCVTPYTYPDKPGTQGNQVTPEAATALPTVSADGKTYKFSIRPGFKFSPGGGPGAGTAVTAKTFAFVLDRDLKMQSGFTPFLSVIQGADEVSNGKSQHISGVSVKGNTLTIRLTQPTPDFTARLATRFMCAVPLSTPIDPKNPVNTVPGAGPYYIAARNPNHSLVLKTNPNYHGSRPHNFSTISYTIGVDLNASVLQVQKNQADYQADGLPPAPIAQLSRQYGKGSALGKKGKAQFFVFPEVEIDYLGLNTSRPEFGNNLSLRKAVNYIINRKLMEQTRGAFAGQLTANILPPNMAGFIRNTTYPLNAPNPAKAAQLAGHGSNGTAVLYTCNSGSCPLRAQVIQANLQQIGVNVQVQQFSRATQFTKEGIKGEPFDIADEGWLQDYPDPQDFINILLNGESIQAANNNNFSYFNDASFNKAIDKDNSLPAPKRYVAFGRLDNNIMNDAAPWAPYDNRNDREFFSARVGCQLFQPIYEIDLGALCLR